MVLTPYICIFMNRLINKSREIIACGLSPFFIPVFILFSAYVEAVDFRNKSLCGRNSCLTMVKEESYTEIKVSPKTRNLQACFIRWENYKYNFKLNNNFKTFYLRSGFHHSGIQWQCDNADVCQY